MAGTIRVILILSLSSGFIVNGQEQNNEIPSVEQQDEDKGFIVSGFYKEDLPSPIFYETFIPAVYEFVSPKWNKTDITFNNWYTCVSETVPYRYSCPVVFHMNNAVVNLHVDFEAIQPVKDIGNNTNYYERLIFHSKFCDKIEKHFNGLYVQQEELQFYLDALRKCHFGSGLLPYIDRNLSQYNYSIRFPFTKMENNFYNTFYKHILNSTVENLDLVASAVLSNARITLQGSILAMYYAEKNRWTHAMQDCASQIIPHSLVTHSQFNDTLSKIQKSGSSSVNFVLHDFSIGLESISKYYSLPITDCTHTSEAFIVRILIPIVKKVRTKSLQLVQIHNIPFRYKTNLCSLKMKSRGNDFKQPKYYIYEEISSIAYHTECLPNELCQINDIYSSESRNAADPCVSSLLSGNNTGIRINCEFECVNREDNFPVVHRIASNKYVLSASGFTFKVVCAGKPEEEFKTFSHHSHNNQPTSNSEQFGALLVTLPCKCHVVLPGHHWLFSEIPCKDDTLSVVKIIPLHFTAESENERKNDAESSFTLEEIEGNVLQRLKLANLTSYIDFSKIEQMYYVSVANLKTKPEANKLDGTARAGDINHLESVHSNTILWAVFIVTTIIILSIQIYIMYTLRIVQQTSYPKDDRILYRVPDSPVMHM